MREELNWDDGGPSNADDYSIEEQILVGDMSIITSLTQNKLDEMAALSNVKDLEYRLVFKDGLNVTGIGTDDASDLYLTILGQEYEINSMTPTSITVVTSEEVTLSPDESVTVDGKTFTLTALSATSAQVNGETVSTSSTSVDGYKVRVKSGSIFYNENFPEDSSVTLQIGEEITETFTSGDDYIGEDASDVNWRWTISDPSADDGYIGVIYAKSVNDHNDDEIVFAGDAYTFPENFGQVKFDGLTDLDYEDITISFETVDLYNSTDATNALKTESAPVVRISISSGDDFITTTTSSYETDTIYLFWADNSSETEGSQTAGTLELFFQDDNDDIGSANYARFVEAFVSANDATIATDPDLADIEIGDTVISVTADVTSGDATLIFTDNGAGQAITFDLAGSEALTNTTGTFEWFGATTTAATSQDTAEATDIIVGSTNVGTAEYDVLQYQGIIIPEPKDALESDEVILNVPYDRVYGIASVLVGGSATSGSTGIMRVTDSEATSMTSKNLIVVGGSAINSVAANLLGVTYPTREAAFTAATDVAAGEAMIKSFAWGSGKTALLVAGYNAVDTDKAVAYLLAQDDVDTSVGSELKVMSATEATVVAE
jgi:hypothetical protein